MQPGGGGFQTAHELGQQRKRVIKISTGSKALDAILGGWVHLLISADTIANMMQWISDYEYQ